MGIWGHRGPRGAVPWGRARCGLAWLPSSYLFSFYNLNLFFVATSVTQRSEGCHPVPHVCRSPGGAECEPAQTEPPCQAAGT